MNTFCRNNNCNLGWKKRDFLLKHKLFLCKQSSNNIFLVFEKMRKTNTKSCPKIAYQNFFIAKISYNSTISITNFNCQESIKKNL